MNISHKLCVSTLQRECLTFLLTHAAGKPIKAMRIAELFQEEELYRESSRFVLDNPGGWSEYELNTLSQETLLKLEKRRNWFLERVLKLGLTMIAKEYQCVREFHFLSILRPKFAPDAVPHMPRSSDVRSSIGGEMAAGLSRRLPLW